MENTKPTTAQRAEILTQALPYIQKYYNKIVVVKYGGNAMINEDLKNAVMGDIVLLSLIGVKVVLVHGGGPEITEMLGKIGKKSEFIDGLRVTDGETMDVVQMVLVLLVKVEHGGELRQDHGENLPVPPQHFHRAGGAQQGQQLGLDPLGGKGREQMLLGFHDFLSE